MSDNFGDLLKSALNCLAGSSNTSSIKSFARLLSVIERNPLEVIKLKSFFSPPRLTLRIGITGPPGAGKSTLISQLIQKLRDKNLSVGVLAVDPSSPYSRGAILGDRLRYQEHFLDKKVFIRSVSSRGAAGGLSSSIYFMSRAFDWSGCDVLLIETVGVGQTELEIMHAADFVTLVLVPESGDSIQAMKAGITEIADFFIVNKADRPGAEALLKELEIWASQQNKPVLLTSALKNEGIDKVIDHLWSIKEKENISQKRSTKTRLRAEVASVLRTELEKEIDRFTSKIDNTRDLIEALKKFKTRKTRML